MAGISRWNHDRIIRHPAIKNGNSQPEHRFPRGSRSFDFRARVKLLENVAMVSGHEKPHYKIDR
jgi:hypothetical protein